MAKKVQEKSTLTLTKINKQVKTYNETHLFEFSDGEKLNIKVRFRPSLVEEMLEEYGQFLNAFEEMDFNFTEKQKIYFLHFMIIKYFTDLSSIIPDEPKDVLSVFTNLVETIYFKEIIEDGFLKEEINKIWDKATDVSANYLFLEKMNNDVQDKIGKLELNNRELIESAFTKVSQKKQIPEV